MSVVITVPESGAVQYGFVSGGGGVWYSKTLQLLSAGDRVWVNVPGSGFVGVGRVTGRAQPAASFKIASLKEEVSVFDVAKRGNYHREFINNPDKCEYFVPVQWLQIVPLEKAVKEIGLFGNQNTVCKPRSAKWRSTVERLKQQFPGFDKIQGPPITGLGTVPNGAF